MRSESFSTRYEMETVVMKKKHRLAALALATIVIALACAAQQVPLSTNGRTQIKRARTGPPPKQTLSTNDGIGSREAPVIVQLEQRNKIITIKTGPDGPVYCVKTKDGKALIQNLTAKELQARDPRLYQFIKPAVAGSANEDGNILDASLKTRPDSASGLPRLAPPRENH